MDEVYAMAGSKTYSGLRSNISMEARNVQQL